MAAHAPHGHKGVRVFLLPLPACLKGVYARLRRAMERVGVRGPFRKLRFATQNLWRGPLTRNEREERAHSDLSPQAARLRGEVKATVKCDRVSDRDGLENQEERMLGTKQRLSNALLTSTACLTAVGLILAPPPTAQPPVPRIALETKPTPALHRATSGNPAPLQT